LCLFPRYANYNTEIPPIPGVPDPRKKYEGIFSFVWEPAEERARILYMGNLQEVDVIPDKWHPTKHVTPNHSSEVRVLSNDLVVYECKFTLVYQKCIALMTYDRNILKPIRKSEPKLPKIMPAENYFCPVNSNRERLLIWCDFRS